MQYKKYLIVAGFIASFFGSSNAFAATASLTPSSFDYGDAVTGTTVTQDFTLTHTGGAGSLTITSSTVSGASTFTKVVDGCTGNTSLTVMGTTCTVTVQYAPTTSGAVSVGMLTLVTNATDGTQKLSSLAGTAVVTVTGTLTPSSFDFGNVTIGSSSTQTFTFTNTGGLPNLTVTSATVSAAPFLKIGDTCTGASIPALGTCTIDVAYNPTAVSISFGTLTVVTNASDGTTKISNLVGTGVSGTTVTADISPTDYDYGSVTTSTSSTNTFTITNTGGSGNLTITSATVSAAPFLKVSDTCTGASLPFAATCDIEVEYNPTAVAVSFGTLTLVTNATNGTTKIASLVGTGASGTTVTGSISPASFNFGEVDIGATDSQTFTITNTGGSGSLTITSATISGAPFVKTSDNCTGASLALAQTCTIDVSYSPTVAGVYAGTLTVVTNATNGTNKIVSVNGTISTPGVLEFSSSTFQFNNDIETAVIYVTRSSGSSGAASVDYTTAPGTASEPGGDYEEIIGTLVWSDGDSSPKQINITINENSFSEESRHFSVILSDPNGASLGTNRIAMIELFVPGGGDEVSQGEGGCSTSGNQRGFSSVWMLFLALIAYLMVRRRQPNMNASL